MADRPGLGKTENDVGGHPHLINVESPRGASAIGLYNFVHGVVYLPASVIAGLLWALHPTYAFGFAAAVTVAAMSVFVHGLSRRNLSAR